MTTPPNAGDVDRNRPWAPPDALAPPPSPEAPAPAASEPAESTPARRTDRTAVVALVTGLIGLVPLAVPFAVAAPVRLRRGTRKGAALAVTALAASLAWTAAGTIVVVLPLSASTLERDASGVISKGGEAPFTELREGDCFTGHEVMVPIEPDATIRAVACTEPHTGEIVARLPLPDDAIASTSGALCKEKSMHLRKSRVREELVSSFGVSRAGRGAGGRWLVCAQHYLGGELRTPLAATVDHSVKTYEELTPGTCIADWTVERPIVTSVVPCGEPHWNEVFATYELSAGEVDVYDYPGAVRRCSAEAGKLFRKAPLKPGLEVDGLPPLLEDRDDGILTVLCTVRATGEGMRGLDHAEVSGSRARSEGTGRCSRHRELPPNCPTPAISAHCAENARVVIEDHYAPPP